MPHGPFTRIPPKVPVRPEFWNVLQMALENTPTLAESGGGPLTDAAINAAATTINAKIARIDARVVDLTSPVWGLVGDGIADDTVAFQAVINSVVAAGGGVISIGNFTPKVTATLKTGSNVRIVGNGLRSNIIASNVSGPVIMTYGGTGEAYTDRQYLADFNISGTASCAVAFSHFTNSSAERLYLQGFTGTDGFVFEHSHAAIFTALTTHGATISRACFKVNMVVLDSEWTLCYTSNLSDFSLYIDQAARQYSTSTAVGFGRINFNTFTAQGAEVAALGLIDLLGPVVFTNMYTENNQSIVALGRHTVSGGIVDFHGCDFTGIRAGTAYQALIQQVSQINFFGGRFEVSPIVIGSIFANINFFGTGVVGNAEMMAQIHRTADTPSNMPVFIQGDVSTQHPRMIMKHNNFGWGFFEMAVNSTGGWTAIAKSPTLSDWQPISSLTATGTTATATSAAHGYTTGNSIRIAGASPKVYNGTFAVTVTDVNTFTYTLTAAPSASPAIGQPMAKV